MRRRFFPSVLTNAFYRANRGIGLELARQLLQQPSNTIIGTARDPAKATALRALEEDGKGTLHVVGLDTIDRESVRKAAGEVKAILGPDGGIDYLVNNAGIAEDDSPYTINIDVLEKILKTNVSGPAYVSQVFLPFVEKSTKKTIVNISSSMGSMVWKMAGARAASYSISKAALNMLVRIIHNAYKPKLIDPFLDRLSSRRKNAQTSRRWPYVLAGLKPVSTGSLLYGI